MSKDVFVYIEQRDAKLQKVSLELLGKGRLLAEQLGQEVVAVLVGHNVEPLCETLIEHGADQVIVVDHPMLQEYVTEPYAKAVTAAIRANDPEIVLYGATSIGRDLAPRIAARIHTGLTADCTALDIDPESKLLLMTRPAFGGNIMATILCEKHRPQMATVRPGVMLAMEPDSSRTGRVTRLSVPFTDEDMNVTIKGIFREEKRQIDITEAKVLVSGGRGLNEAEGFQILGELAEILEAELSGSRAAVEAGWIEQDRQVGQTGKTVRPDLYFAFGISGAIQHIAGMEGSDYIIAVNKNNTAPIFETADLGIVGDLYDIVPRLVQALRHRR
ncbi:MAG: electron transfer flavoprotein subunit alpha/FixB family protein [Oscillospiraceae bacterium]|jgi:electron transfer flavoprotein alpha subunit